MPCRRRAKERAEYVRPDLNLFKKALLWGGWLLIAGASTAIDYIAIHNHLLDKITFTVSPFIPFVETLFIALSGVLMARLGLRSVQAGHGLRGVDAVELLAAIYIYLSGMSLFNAIIGIRDNSVSPWIVTHDFWISVYFTTMTVTTVGYGDFTPNGPPGRAVACVAALSGYLILAFLIAIISHPRNQTWL